MKKAVFALVTTEAQAQRVVDSLLASGFSNSDISILYPDRNKTKIDTNAQGQAVYKDSPVDRNTTAKRDISIEKKTKAPEGGVAGATTGGILGGSLGLLAGIGALAIPGLGPFIAAGPIIAALSGSAVGGSVGLLVGALIGSGIPKYAAEKYEAGLKQGNILISVHVDSEDELDEAKEIFRREDAKDIAATSEKSKA